MYLPEVVDQKVEEKHTQSLQLADELELLQSYQAELKANQKVCREQVRQMQPLGLVLPEEVPLNGFTEELTPTQYQVAAEALENAIDVKSEELSQAVLESASSYATSLQKAIDAMLQAQTDYDAILLQIDKLNDASKEPIDAISSNEVALQAVSTYVKQYNALMADLCGPRELHGKLSTALTFIPTRFQALMDVIGSEATLETKTEAERFYSQVERLAEQSAEPVMTLSEFIKHCLPDSGDVDREAVLAIHGPLCPTISVTADGASKLNAQETLDRLKEWLSESDDAGLARRLLTELSDIHDIVLSVATYRAFSYGKMLDCARNLVSAGIHIE